MNLIICIHNHQPVGNMDFILEEAYQKSYLPFFEILKDFEDIRINLHFSGYLLTWLCEHKPDYIALLKSLKDRGQIEIVSGGMYEPILSLLSENDAVAQIKMHMDFAEGIFGDRPAGIWLAERVYEPHIPRVIDKAGARFTLVDDYHFKAVGMSQKELYGYSLTEFEGHKLFIFPGLEFLRYAIPFKPIDDIDRYFREMEKNGDDLAVFGDDGEKFGLWPGTYEHVYNGGWLKSFFTYLSENKKWLKTATFSEYISHKNPKNRVYLNCNSYMEMAEWCLPASRAGKFEEFLNNAAVDTKEFVKGGYFKHFLVKYDECNDMHKKMVWVTDKADKNSEAKAHVFMAQCNDSYWHGVFGGLYLPHLRSTVYRHLIEAEKILDSKKTFVDGNLEDINFDGFDEAVLSNRDLKAYFLLKEGGVLYELDYKPSRTNIMATLSRRYEAYHDKIKVASSAQAADGTKTIHDLVIAKEEGLGKYLHYDWYRRASFVDHIMGKDVTFDNFYRSSYSEPGDFVKEPYQAIMHKDMNFVKLILKRDGHYWKNDQGYPLSLEKSFLLEKDSSGLIVNYSIEGAVKERFLLGVELNFSFLGSGGDRYMDIGEKRLGLAFQGNLDVSGNVVFHDPYQNIIVSLDYDMPAFVWTYPVEVVSLSEHGFERNYQSTMLMPVWEIDLTKGPKNISIRLQLNR